MNTAGTSSMTALAEQLSHQAFERRKREIAAHPSEALAEIVALPEYTFALFQTLSPYTVSSENAPILDKLLEDGWITNRASFVPGECVISPETSSTVKVEAPPMERSALEELKRVGLAPPTLEWPLKNQGEADPTGFEPLVLPAGQLRCRSLGIAWNAMAPFSRHSAVRITLTPANTDFPPLELTGAVFSSTGSRWSGYETIVSLHKASQQKFAAALYQHFGVPASRRSELIALLSDVSWLSTCQRLAEGGMRARRQKVPIPPQTVRWIRLARKLKHRPSAAARHLIRLVEELLRRGLDGEVIALLDAAALLAQTVGADLVAAVGLGQRRLELHHREQVDERRLAQFYERPEQLQPFERLMTDADHWGLHYLGTAGVGKTMLMRFLNRRLLANKQAVARVDFDYLSADFPVRRPAQLLLELADGLQLHIRDTQTEGSFREFQNRVDYIHREVESEPSPHDPLGNLHREEFQSVLSAFCDFLIRLPQPVVLFLDTCEELARLQPDGRFQPGVQATFEILERIQKRLEGSTASLRVIFAGRRLLAISGAGWRSKGAALEERQRQFSTVDQAAAEPKEFLSLHEIRGFTETEARDYLLRRLSASRRDEDFRGDHPLVRAIISRSRDNTTACDFEFTADQATPAGDRFNPFDLSLYADWAIDDPSLRAETIAAGGTDPYIEIRIIRRLRGAVLEVLPTLLLLRRTTKAWLADIFQLDAAKAENLYRELCQIEWMDYQPGGNEGAWLEVDRNLRPRLERYYQGRERTAEIENARRALERWISRALAANRKPDTALLSAALRLLPPEDAAEFWSQLERRIAGNGDWHWALPICEQLLAEEGTVGVPLQAAVNATFAAARLQTQKQPDVLRLWEMVGQTAPSNPLPNAAQWLADRAVAGAIAAKAQRGEAASANEMARFWQLVRQRPSPNWGAAIEALASLRGETKEPPDFEAILFWRRSADFPRHVAGVAEAMLPIPSGPLIESEANLAVEVSPEQASDRVNMPDWPLPSRLVERLRLHLLSIGSVAARDRSLLHRWRDEAMLHLETPDSAWLIARIIEVAPPTERAELSELTDRLRDVPYTPPTTWTQQHTLPMFVALANAWNEAGDPEQALALLDPPLEAATLDPIATVQAQRSKARLLRKHKMVERAQLFLNTLQSSPVKPDSVTLELLEETVAPSAPEKRRKMGVGMIVSLILSVGFLVGLVYLTIRLFGWLYSFWLPTTGSGWRLPTFLLVLMAIMGCVAMLPRLSRRITYYWDRLSDLATTLSLDLTPSRPDSVGRTEITVRLLGRRLPHNAGKRLGALISFYTILFSRVLMPRNKRRNWQSAARDIALSESFALEATWRAEQHETLTDLKSLSDEKDAVILELQRLVERVTPHDLPLAISGEPSASYLNWEEALASLLAGKQNARPKNFAPFRVGPMLGEEIPGRWRAVEKNALRTVMTRSWEGPIRQAWANGARSVTNRLADFFVENGPAPAETSANFRICHLLGETLRRRNTVRFRASRTAIRSGGETLESQSEEDDRVRSAEQLLLEEKGMFVLQEIPEASGDRLQTDRERTSEMRRFAQELFQGGAWAVLLIPNLPSALALQVVERLGHLLGLRTAPSVWSLVRITNLLRQEIAKAAAHGAPEFLSELAWEVTLFARSGEHASLVEKNQTHRPPDSSETA